MDDQKALELLIKKKELGITDEELEAFKRGFQSKHQVVADATAEELMAPASPFDNLTDQEILYYATPYFDELQAKKDLQTSQRKDDEALK